MRLLCTVISMAYVIGIPNFTTDMVEVLNLTPSLGAMAFSYGFRAGNYGYLVPLKSDKVARIDLVNFVFQDFIVLTAADPELVGFSRGVTDGVYGYLAPARSFYSDYSGAAVKGKIVRFSLQNFSSSAVEVLSLLSVSNQMSGWNDGFCGFCADSNYVYAMPMHVTGGKNQGSIARFEFATFSNVEVVSFFTDSNRPSGSSFVDCFIEGNYGYMLPTGTSASAVARFTLSSPFHEAIADYLSIDSDEAATSHWTGFVGGFADGTYGYLTPSSYRIMVRFSLATFDNPEGLDLGTQDAGWKGGFADGTWAYLSIRSVKVTRFDLATFSEIDTLNLPSGLAASYTLAGYTYGFRDDTFGYTVPYYECCGAARNMQLARFPLGNPLTTTTTSTTITTTTTTTTSTTTTSSTTASRTITSATEEILPTTRNEGQLAILCQLTVRVSNATFFVDDPNIIDVLRQAIADLHNVSTTWVWNVAVSLKTPRALGADESGGLLYGDVNIQWQIVAPPGSDKAIVVILFENYEQLTMQAVTHIINLRLADMNSEVGYELEVTWKFAKLQAEEDKVVAGDVESSSSKILLVVILCAVLLTTCALTVIIWRLLKAKHGNRMLLLRSSTSSQSLTVSGSLYDRTAQSFLYPPKAVSIEQGDEIRRYAQSLQTSAANDVEVFLTYAHGQRIHDDEGMGPGMFFATSILVALHEGGVPCFSELMLPWESNRTEFCDVIAKSSTSCKVMIVIQTLALYNCRYALKEMFTALKHDIRLMPLRFDDDLPPSGFEWPQITREDVEGMVMVAQVQIALCSSKPLPLPPCTIPGDPKMLGVVLEEVSLMIARSHTTTEQAFEPSVSVESTESVSVPRVIGVSSSTLDDEGLRGRLDTESESLSHQDLLSSQVLSSQDLLSSQVLSSQDLGTTSPCKDKSADEGKRKSRAAKSFAKRGNRRSREETLKNSAAKQTGDLSASVSSMRLPAKPARITRPIDDSDTRFASIAKDKSSRARRSEKPRATIRRNSNSDSSPISRPQGEQGNPEESSHLETWTTPRTTRKTKPGYSGSTLVNDKTQI